jgi:hypothetical protein
VALLDGILKLDAAKEWDVSPFIMANGPTITASMYFSGAYPSQTLLLPEQWSDVHVTELGGTGVFASTPTADSESVRVRASLGVGVAAGTSSPDAEASRGYARGEISLGATRTLQLSQRTVSVRVYGGFARNAPRQRAVFASSQDPFETFANDFYRPRGALLKQDGVNFLPLGGAGLRGFDEDLALDRVLAGNAQYSEKLYATRGAWGSGAVWANAFGDVGIASALGGTLPDPLLVDAGVGLTARGTVYDRPVTIRLDVPLFVNHAGFAGGKGLGGNGSVAARWVLSFGDLW